MKRDKGGNILTRVEDNKKERGEPLGSLKNITQNLRIWGRKNGIYLLSYFILIWLINYSIWQYVFFIPSFLPNKTRNIHSLSPAYPSNHLSYSSLLFSLPNMVKHINDLLFVFTNNPKKINWTCTRFQVCFRFIIYPFTLKAQVNHNSQGPN